MTLYGDNVDWGWFQRQTLYTALGSFREVRHHFTYPQAKESHVVADVSQSYQDSVKCHHRNCKTCFENCLLDNSHYGKLEEMFLCGISLQAKNVNLKGNVDKWGDIECFVSKGLQLLTDTHEDPRVLWTASLSRRTRWPVRTSLQDRATTLQDLGQGIRWVGERGTNKNE